MSRAGNFSVGEILRFVAINCEILAFWMQNEEDLVGF
jgi:hypothetical protein